MLDGNAAVLFTQHGAHRRAYLPTSQRVSTTLGLATVRYLTEDGYVAVHVDGDPELRVEEIPAEHCEIVQPADDLVTVTRRDDGAYRTDAEQAARAADIEAFAADHSARILADGDAS